MIRRYRYLSGIIALCIIWGACKQQRQTCLTPKIASLIVETMHKISDTGTVFYDTVLPAAEFAPLTNPDSIQVFLSAQASSFTLSLSPDHDTCQWLFRADTVGNNPRAALFDTITFYYQRKLQFLSNACGYTNFYNLDSIYTSHFNIDSVHIINASVTNNVNTKHVQIFIHPDF